MRELTPETITDAVLDQMATTPDPRLKAIMASAVKHLHAFAREVNLTPAEWIKGIEFMTAAGKMCSRNGRSSFCCPIRSACRRWSMACMTRRPRAGHHTSLLGPFYREATPTACGRQLDRQKSEAGQRVRTLRRVTDAGGQPVANATVSIWQTGADGLYDIQASATSVDYRGVFSTDADALRAAYRQAARVLDPDGRACWRHGEGAGAAWHEAGAYSLLVGAPGYRELVTAL